MMSADAEAVAWSIIDRLRLAGLPIPPRLTVIAGNIEPFNRPRALALYRYASRTIILDPARICGTHAGDEAEHLVMLSTAHEVAHSIATPQRQPHGSHYLRAARRVAAVLGLPPPTSTGECRGWPRRPRWFVTRVP
jgi:hypothetical protein